MKKLIIAEKPSVAKNIADALNIKKRNDGYFEGDEYLITWVFGHLLTLFNAEDYDENMKRWSLEKFPFIPEHFKYKVTRDSSDKTKADAGAEKQIRIINKLINNKDVDGVIAATDYDREGELIAYELLKFLKVKKSLYRILLNEWTPDEVKKALKKLIPYKEMKSLQEAGLSRQLADWIIGANLTAVSTLKYNYNNAKVLNIGRVLLPTLKIIYDRDKEIEKFESKTYYKLNAEFETAKKEKFVGTYIVKKADNFIDKFEDKEQLEDIAKKLINKGAKIVKKEIVEGKEYAPNLFNLTQLQGYVTSKYKGWTSDKVLKVAQSLYEKKFTTYPRTGSIALDESLKDKTKKVLEVVKKGLPYENEIKFTDNKRIFNNSKVEGHSAIIPTYLLPKGLTVDEEIVYNAIRDRFLEQFMPVAEYEETKVAIKVDDKTFSGLFMTKGKIQKVLGWKIIEGINSLDYILPLIEKGDSLVIDNATTITTITKPPKPHTEKTLLRVMETCGKSFKNDDNSDEMMASILSGFSIGTPATRAETISKLKRVGYIESKGKSLSCTDLGITLIENYPVKNLLNLEYTGQLEKTLSDIEKNKYNMKDFLNLINKFTIESVNAIKNDNSALCKGSANDSVDKEIIGVCPACGGEVIETKLGYSCSNWKSGCKFTIWKKDKYFGKTITKTVAKKLLKDKKILIKGLKTKGKETYDAYYEYIPDKDGRFNWNRVRD